MWRIVLLVCLLDLSQLGEAQNLLDGILGFASSQDPTSDLGSTDKFRPVPPFNPTDTGGSQPQQPPKPVAAKPPTPTDPLTDFPPLDDFPPLGPEDFDFIPNMPTGDPFLNLMTNKEDNFRPVNNWAADSSSSTSVPGGPAVPEVALPSVPVKPKPSVPVKPKPSVPVQSKPSVPVWQQPSVPVQPKPSVPVKPKPSVPVWPKPSVPVQSKPSVPVQPKPSVPVWPKPSVPVWPKPSVPVWPQPSVPVLPKPSVPDVKPPRKRKERPVFVVSKKKIGVGKPKTGVLQGSTSNRGRDMVVVRKDEVPPQGPIIPAGTISRRGSAALPAGKLRGGFLPAGHAKRLGAASWIPVVYPSGRPAKVQKKLQEIQQQDPLHTGVQDLVREAIKSFPTDRKFARRMKKEMKRIRSETKKEANTRRAKQREINRANRGMGRGRGRGGRRVQTMTGK